jgi:short-subunit dehydrogenase
MGSAARTASARSGSARRIAVVTGAASGIGREIALRLADAGYTVAAVDIDTAALTTLCASRPPSLRPFTCDVACGESVSAVHARVREQIGPVGFLINAAGIAAGGPVTASVASLARTAMNVNYLGTVQWVEAVLPGMLAEQRGTIVNIASLAALVPCPGMGVYAASKAAVAMYSEILSSEVRPRGVRVVCICPPAVDTPLLSHLVDQGAVPAGIRRFMKPLQPAEVAAAVVRAMRSRKTVVVLGAAARTVWRVSRWAPHLTQAFCSRYLTQPQ